MDNQQFLYESDSSVMSSTSSYSQIIPREESMMKLRKDKPIVMRSIPISKEQRVHRNMSIKQHNDEMGKTMCEMSGNLVGEDKDKKGVNDKVEQVEKNMNKVEQNDEEMVHGGGCRVKIGDKQQSEVIVQINSQQQGGYTETVDGQIQNCYQQPDTLIRSAIANHPSVETCQSSPDNTILNYSISSQSSSKKPITTKADHIKTIHEQQQYQQQQQQYLLQKNQHLQQRLKSLQSTLKSDSQSIQLQRKANQIYTEFYHTLSKIVSQFLKLNPPPSIVDLSESQRSISATSSQLLNQTVNMDKVIHTVARLILSYQKYSIIMINSKQQAIQHAVQTQFMSTLNYNNDNTQTATIDNYVNRIKELQIHIEEGKQQIDRLKSQLIQSTQNNINAIFNTELSSQCCLEHQVNKINTEMNRLKEKIDSILANNNHQQQQQYYPQPQLQPQIIYLLQPNIQPNLINEKQSTHQFINIQSSYQQDTPYDNQHPQQSQNNNNKLQHSLNKQPNKYSQSKSQKQISSSSSMLSSKQTKKREEMSRMQIEQLKQAYMQTKNQLNALISTLSMISNSQLQMRAYFNEVKQGFLREMSEKFIRMKEESEDEIDRRAKQKRRQQQQVQNAIRENEKQLYQQYTQIIKQNQSTYHNHLHSLQTQHIQNQQTISELHNHLLQLSHKTSVPERVTQQFQSKSVNPQLINQQQQLPVSQISVSVDWLRVIEQLREENHILQEEIALLVKQNDLLKREVQNNMSVVRNQAITRKNVYYSDPRDRKHSIINDLNQLSKDTQACYSMLPIRTKEGFELHKNKFYGKVKEGLESLQYIESPNTINQSHKIINHPINIKISQTTQNITQLQSQRNQYSNIKTILQSKQSRIKNLQKQILNLQQTTEYLKQQLLLRQKTIKQLETYIYNLQSRSSQNSNTMSQKRINSEPEINVYSKQQNTIDSMKIKYQNYVKNLKLLLKQAQNQNHLLKQQLLRVQKSLSQRLDNSMVDSQQTTKNFLTQTSPTNQRSLTEIGVRRKYQQNSTQKNQLRQQRITTFTQ